MFGKIKKIVALTSGIVFCMGSVAYASVNSEPLPDVRPVFGYGTFTAAQRLTEQDYNEICWVTVSTSVTDYNRNINTFIRYNLVYNDGSGTITGDIERQRPAMSVSDVVMLSNYGYYDDVSLALFSTHSASGNGYCEPSYLLGSY